MGEIELAFRDEVPLINTKGRNAYESTHAVLASAGPSTKFSTKYTFTADTRDSGTMPTSGSYISSTFELAMPPGTAQFAKLDLSAQTHQLLTPIRLDGEPGLVGSLCYNMGILQPL